MEGQKKSRKFEWRAARCSLKWRSIPFFCRRARSPVKYLRRRSSEARRAPEESRASSDEGTPLDFFHISHQLVTRLHSSGKNP